MKKIMMWALALVAFGAFADGKVDKGELVKTFGKEDAKAFTILAVQRAARFEELSVFQRVLKEKAAEYNEILSQLDGEHGLDPKKSYTYETKSRTLFELVPPAQEGKEPTKKEVTVFKDDEAAAGLAKAMIARKLVENQLSVLRQLSGEKAQEAELVDKKIRKTYNLEPDGIYNFDADESKIYKTGTRERPAADKAADKTAK